MQFEWQHQGAGLARFEARWSRRVLLNLLSNAVNASPADGTIHLRSQLRDDHWQLSVEDEGADGCGLLVRITLPRAGPGPAPRSTSERAAVSAE